MPVPVPRLVSRAARSLPSPARAAIKAGLRGLRLLEKSPSEDWHVGFVEHLARILRPGVYVELGIYQAELLNRVAPLAGRAYGIDIDPKCGEYVRKTANVEFHACTTSEFALKARARGLTIDLLFIDADHCRDAVLADFGDFLPLVRPHGLILLHDTHPGNEALTAPGYCCDAYKAVQELQDAADGYELMTIPISPGLTICRKRESQLNWMEPS